MVWMRRMTMCVFFGVLLAGCSESGKEAAGKAAEGFVTGAEHLWGDQTRALEKAKEVEKMLQDAADRQRRAIEEQSR